jgi:hypothetical protein
MSVARPIYGNDSDTTNENERSRPLYGNESDTLYGNESRSTARGLG